MSVYSRLESQATMAFVQKELCVVSESRFLQPSESLLIGNEKANVIKQVGEIFNLKNKTALRFPGGQPYSIRRNEIPNLKKGYYASLKADGVRFMLFLTKNEGEHKAVMIDRLMNVYEVEIWGNAHFFDGSLFDGELVWDYGEKPPTLSYLVFDTICAKGKSLVSETYEKRIIEANRCIISNIPHFLSGDELDQYLIDEDKIYSCNNYHGLKLCIKKVLPVDQLSTIWEARHALNHMNDGIIFTKNTTVKPHYDVYKWKPENTLDIMFSSSSAASNSQMDIYIRNGSRLVLHRDITIANVNYKFEISENRMIQCIVQSEFKRECDSVKFVAECICDVDQTDKIITIFPVKRRADKTSPNNITTISETIHNILENVQVTEFYDILSDSCSANSASANVSKHFELNDSSQNATVGAAIQQCEKRKGRGSKDETDSTIPTTKRNTNCDSR